MNRFQDSIKIRIDEQKKFYKDAKDSPCRDCLNYNKDCFDYFKTLGRDSKTGFSVVEKCSGRKEWSAE